MAIYQFTSHDTMTGGPWYTVKLREGRYSPSLDGRAEQLSYDGTVT